jgi:hypothetical protein
VLILELLEYKLQILEGINTARMKTLASFLFPLSKQFRQIILLQLTGMVSHHYIISKLIFTCGRHFKDKNGIYYPQSIKLLIIVIKRGQVHESWFPFRLRLNWNLYVDTCHGSLFQVSRFVNRIHKHDGWKFDISGKYQQKIAEEALEDVEHLKEGNAKTVGLKAAARNYLNERRQ